MSLTQTRRRFLATTGLAGAAALIRPPRVLAAEGPPETTSVRITKNQNICYAPEYLAEELLRDEGFTDIRYVDTSVPEIGSAIAQGNVDFGMNYALLFVRDIDARPSP